MIGHHKKAAASLHELHNRHLLRRSERLVRFIYDKDLIVGKVLGIGSILISDSCARGQGLDMMSAFNQRNSPGRNRAFPIGLHRRAGDS